MIKKNILIWMTAALAFCACSSSENNGDEGEIDPPSPHAVPIKISTTMEGVDGTRATDYGFEAGDRIGLFVVNHNADGTPGTLQPVGNHVDNMRFTYSGTWTPDEQIYWKDETTRADFYLYYPYTTSVASVSAMPFSTMADQSSLSAYKASDLLVGITKGVAPTETAVGITASHMMSQMMITLVAGNGFTEESLAKADVSVKINGIKTQSTVNLATKAVTPAGTATGITPLKEDGSYKALIVPQSVAEGNLITVTVDGRDYNLQKAFTFESGKRHRFTVTLSKTSNGINVTIDQWEDDGTDNGGTAE